MTNSTAKPPHGKAYRVTNQDRRLVALYLTMPDASWRGQLPRLTRKQRLALHDAYYALAMSIENLPGGINHERRKARELLFDFSWHLNDIAIQYHEFIRRASHKRLPGYGKELASARRRGRIPRPDDNGIHVAIGCRPGYHRAARGAFLWAEPSQSNGFADVCFSFLAGLNVEILATGADMWIVDELARELRVQGVRRVVLRRLDCTSWPTERRVLIGGGSLPVRHFDETKNYTEVLYEGDRPWRR
jgi:hypothetical protein